MCVILTTPLAHMQLSSSVCLRVIFAHNKFFLCTIFIAICIEVYKQRNAMYAQRLSLQARALITQKKHTTHTQQRRIQYVAYCTLNIAGILCAFNFSVLEFLVQFQSVARYVCGKTRSGKKILSKEINHNFFLKILVALFNLINFYYFLKNYQKLIFIQKKLKKVNLNKIKNKIKKFTAAKES